MTGSHVTPLEMCDSPRVCVYSSLEQLPSAYRELFEKTGRDSLFYSYAWFDNFLATIAPFKETLRIYGVELEQRGAPACMLLMRQPVSGETFFNRRTLAGLQNYYTSLFGPIMNPSIEDPAMAIKVLVRKICSELPRWASVDLHPMDVDSLVFRTLVEAFRESGFVPHTYFCFGNWYLRVGNRSFKEYFESLPSVVKNTIRRKSKKLESSGKARIEIVTDIVPSARCIQDYTTVHNSSWKIPEPHQDFIPGLIRSCAAQGWLRLGLAYYEGQPVAAQLWMVCGEVASIFKLAYDERYAHLSAGSVLTARMMEHVIDVDRVSEIDYLTGDDAYKKDWMSHRRERWGIVAFNLRTFPGAMLALRHCGGRVLKEWGKLALRLLDKSRAVLV